MRSRKFQVKLKHSSGVCFIIIDLLNGSSDMSLLAVNIAEFVDQNEMYEKFILVGL